MDPSDSNLVVFSHEKYSPWLPSQLDFMIQVTIHGKKIHRSIVDEGALTYIMSMSCWNVIGSPQLNQLTTTLKSFDGRTYKPYGNLNSLQVELEGKTISIEIEVIDVPLYYNLIYICTWVYDIVFIISPNFRMIVFPHKGMIIAIDQLNLFSSNYNATGSVPLVGEALHSYHHFGVGLLKDSSLMGMFSLPSPPPCNSPYSVADINIISSSTILVDPWIERDETNIQIFGNWMSLSPIE